MGFGNAAVSAGRQQRASARTGDRGDQEVRYEAPSMLFNAGGIDVSRVLNDHSENRFKTKGCH